MGKTKSIVIHDYAGHPLAFDLSKELTKRYNIIHIYTSLSGGPKANFREDIENLTTIKINLDSADKENFIKRFFQVHIMI